MIPTSARSSHLVGRYAKTFATKARPSPTVTYKKRQRITTPTSTLNITGFEPVLRLANRDGLITVTAPEAIAFLEDFEILRAKNQALKSTVTALLERHALQPRALYQLGNVIGRHVGEQPVKPLAQALLRAGAELQDERAAIAFVDGAIRRRQFDPPDVQMALQVLSTLSSKGNIEATERLAAVCKLQGDESRALRYAETVLAARHSLQDEEDKAHPSPIPAWRIVADVKKRMGDIRGSDEATEIGAHHFNDPGAQIDLACLIGSHSADLGIAYLLKAASAGRTAGAYGVGSFLMRATTGKPDGEEYRLALLPLLGVSDIRSVAFPLAAEWFRVALAAAPKGDPTMQEVAAKGAIAAMKAMGDTSGCQALLADYANSSWAEKLSSTDTNAKDP